MSEPRIGFANPTHSLGPRDATAGIAAAIRKSPSCLLPPEKIVAVFGSYKETDLMPDHTFEVIGQAGSDLMPDHTFEVIGQAGSDDCFEFAPLPASERPIKSILLSGSCRKVDPEKLEAEIMGLKNSLVAEVRAVAALREENRELKDAVAKYAAALCEAVTKHGKAMLDAVLKALGKEEPKPKCDSVVTVWQEIGPKELGDETAARIRATLARNARPIPVAVAYGKNRLPVKLFGSDYYGPSGWLTDEKPSPGSGGMGGGET
jgi:hypothetical protein